MSDLTDLYQEVILHHSKAPRNFGALEPHDHEAEGYNPLCGDQVRITARVDGDVIRDLRFQGSGCAISTAAASLMTEAVKGLPIAQADALFDKVRTLLTTDAAPDDDLGKLQVFVGVRQFPMRVKCATLAWHTLHAALHGDHATVTTE
jgi:nitrogen fixation NifU-like protein